MDVVPNVEFDLLSISNLINNGDQFRDFLYSPRVARDEKVAIAERLFSDRVTALTMQFVRVLLEKRRENEFEAIREAYVEMRREHGNVIFALVTSASPLDDPQRQKIEDKLQKSSGKRVEAVYDVDPSVLGGVKVAYGTYVLDGTVKGSLRRLRDSLRHDVMKKN
jgi:F-type H+-transporting ATPase subunit delta